jgi:hypothetical protein
MKIKSEILKHVSDDGGRPFIVEAVEKTVDRYLKNALEPMGHCIPPRCGKSSVIVLTAAELASVGCPATFVIAPWSFLTNQLIDSVKVRGTFAFYAPESTLRFVSDKVENLKHHMFFHREDRDVKMLTMTNSLLHCNVDTFCSAVAVIKEKTGRAPCVIADEVHLIALEDSGWGITIKKIIDAGAFFVGVTGTPTSQDNRDIPGFVYSRVEGSDSVEVSQKRIDMRTVKVDEDGNRTADYEMFKGLRDKYNIRAAHGVNVPWKMAFEKEWLVRMNFHLMDSTVENNKGEKSLLSKIPESEINGNLGDWVRGEHVMTSVLRDALNALVTMTASAIKQGTPTMPRMLVVTSPDRIKKHNDKSNHQAREASKILRGMLENDPVYSHQLGGRKLTIDISTSVTDTGEADQVAVDKMTAFAKGQTDILIVKAMGLVGLDVPECKVLANISEYRKGAMIYQLVTRIGTPWGSSAEDATPGELWASKVRGVYVGPMDARHIEIRNTVEQMGGLDNQTDVTDWESTGETGEQPIDPTDKNDWSVTGESDVNVGTETGDSVDASLEELATVYAVRLQYPDTVSLSDVAIIRMHRSGAFPVSAESLHKYAATKAKAPVKNLSEDREKLKGTFGKNAQTIVNRYIPYRKDGNGSRYGRAISILQGMAKQHCGVYSEVSSIDDPSVLKRLVEALSTVENVFAKAVGRGEV